MENMVIIGIVVVMVIVGIHSASKHFKGKSGCCGGGSSVKAKKKKLKNVVARKTVVIEGMTCDHCRNRVERGLNEMEGVSAKVNLKKKQAVVSMEKEVSDGQIRTVIEKAGYEVLHIK